MSEIDRVTQRRVYKLQEVQALAVAQAHPHIVQYYWSWAENDLHGDFLYIQLELCQDSLADQAKARKAPWNESELLLIMKQVSLYFDTALYHQAVQHKVMFWLVAYHHRQEKPHEPVLIQTATMRAVG